MYRLWVLSLPALSLLVLFVGGQVLVLVDGLSGWLQLWTPAEPGSLARSLWLTLRLAFVSSGLAVLLGLGAAFLLVRRRSAFWLTVQTWPVIVPHMVVALLIINLFTASGLVPRLLYACGLITTMRDFPTLLNDTHGVGMVVAYVWKGLPFAALVTGNALLRLSPRLVESARLLGAGPWRAAWEVTLPLLRPVNVSAFVLLFTFALGAFEIPFLLGATEPRTLAVLIYDGLSSADLARRPAALALSSLLAGICAVLCWMGQRFGVARKHHGE